MDEIKKCFESFTNLFLRAKVLVSDIDIDLDVPLSKENE